MAQSGYDVTDDRSIDKGRDMPGFCNRKNPVDTPVTKIGDGNLATPGRACTMREVSLADRLGHV